MVTLNLKENTIVVSELPVLMEDLLSNLLLELSYLLDWKYQESMEKLLLVNGNIKLVLPKEYNVEIICGSLDTFFAELEKNSELLWTSNVNLFKETGMDQDVILISQLTELELKEDLTLLEIIAWKN